MSVILILILASLAVAVAFLAGFIWAVKVGPVRGHLHARRCAS